MAPPLTDESDDQDEPTDGLLVRLINRLEDNPPPTIERWAALLLAIAPEWFCEPALTPPPMRTTTRSQRVRLLEVRAALGLALRHPQDVVVLDEPWVERPHRGRQRRRSKRLASHSASADNARSGTPG